ncbi:cellulose-binding protein [Verrucosispora sp. WMMC514]|uniref:cellulose-binding protein n=1 Tax=Verrucosispora sp. WMMC514 TaxID=3015156 RepID=UPI00248BFE60|nr:cellulose-binding protein [Verrucosispora sp. WMMC514]WBB91682.1 cellulose-binding protein [Verrucosispora sp. WMMC514]
MSGTRRAPRQFPPHGSAAVASSPWILVSVGVVIMVVLLVIAVGAYRGPGPDFQPGPPGQPPVAAAPIPERASSSGREVSTPPSLAVPGLSPRRTDPPSPTPSASRTTSAPPSVAPSRTTVSPAPSPAPIDARYRVLHTFHGGFIAEVSIRNTSPRDLGWVARVDYPGGRVVTAWLEGVPQGTFSGTGGTLTYRSGPDLDAWSSVYLRFHIESADFRPASCSVSGRTCRSRR